MYIKGQAVISSKEWKLNLDKFAKKAKLEESFSQELAWNM